MGRCMDRSTLEEDLQDSVMFSVHLLTGVVFIAESFLETSVPRVFPFNQRVTLDSQKKRKL